MGQTTSKTPKTHKKTKNPRPSSSMHKLVPFGSKLVPTVFDSSDGCSYKLKSHLLVLMHMQCSKIGLKMFK